MSLESNNSCVSASYLSGGSMLPINTIADYALLCTKAGLKVDSECREQALYIHICDRNRAIAACDDETFLRAVK